jgi:23S rRNA pseudouridine1911/1915/1917 synthase
VTDNLRLFEHTFLAEAGDAGQRLDLFLVARFPGYSRTLLARAVQEGHVAVNESTARKVRPGLRLEPGDRVRVRLPQRTEPYAAPERIPLTVLHEDRWLVAIDKPPGISVHPGAGVRSGTLANALSYHFGELSKLQGPMRPGIVHRLDKNTSGVMLVAKDDLTHHALAAQFRGRTVRKEYHAVTKGVVELDADLVSTPIGPHRRSPTKMAVRLDVGRQSETYYEVLERFRAHTYVRCFPKTGRTHQIRVHMGSVGHPLVSDAAYGGYVPELHALCPRQALHARAVTFVHPATGEETRIEAPLPEDFLRLVAHLRAAGPARP